MHLGRLNIVTLYFNQAVLQPSHDSVNTGGKSTALRKCDVHRSVHRNIFP
jgi:hypothetical protein